MNKTEATEFVAQFISGKYSQDEYASFLDWVENASLDELGAIADQHESLQEDWSAGPEPSAEWIAQIESKLDVAEENERQAPVKKMYSERKRRRNIWMAAASVLILLTTGGYWFLHEPVSMTGTGKKSTGVLLTVLYVPMGQQKDLVLADGTKIWLNAASTLKYPSSFTGKERSVELAGEAYFEVAKNAAMPFRVKINNAKVEVLGTEFNIMAYVDEPVSKTTLVNGSVRIMRGVESVVLQPGEQAQIVNPAAGGMDIPIKVKRDIDPVGAISWKSGNLVFKQDDLHTIARVLSRAYDVNIQYIGAIPDRQVSAVFPIKEGIQEILKELASQDIHFKINENK
ncbi:FecR family protein [Flavitalea flava]